MEMNEPDEMAFMSLNVPVTQLCSWWLQLFIMECVWCHSSRLEEDLWTEIYRDLLPGARLQ